MPSSRFRKYFSPTQVLLYALSITVSVAVFFYLKNTISLQDLTTIISQISLKGVGVFVVFSITMSIFRSWRYILLLRIAGYETNKTDMFLITLVRNFFSDIVPARLGTLIYIFLARSRLGVSWGSASASFAYSFIFDICALGVIIVVAALSAAGLSNHPEILISAGLFLAILSGGFLFSLPPILTLSHSFFSKYRLAPSWLLVRLHSPVQALCKELLLIQKSGMLFRILVLSFGVRCCKYLALYVLLLALVVPAGYMPAEFPLSSVFFGLVAAELAASLPVSGIAGFGAYEGAWIFVFQLLGKSEKLSALTSISHHVLTQLYGYSIGALALVILLVSWRSKKKTVSNQIQQHLSKMQFYKYSILLLVLPLFCFWLLLETGINNSANGSAVYQTKEISQSIVSQPPAGKVVYQRPDGIFTVRIGDKNEIQLSNSGTAPRWSPDGTQITYVDGNKIMLMNGNGQNKRQLADTSKGKAACFHPSGRSVLYTNHDKIEMVTISNGDINVLATGNEFFELDISHDGKFLAVTEKSLFGYQVRVINVDSGDHTTMASGCSASMSPNGSLITVNDSSHRKLHIYARQSAEIVGSIDMVDNLKFDNQLWSNTKNWIASKSEGESQNIYLHHVPSSAGFQATFSGQCDRPDFFIFP